MRRRAASSLLLAIGLTPTGCILRPGMNADCAWPPETPQPLDLANAGDRRHLVTDAELIEELVDRYRFHVPNDQPACEARLIDAAARAHAVSAADVARAHDRVSDRGLDLPVNIPMAALFLLAVWSVMRIISTRFHDEPVPAIVALLIASVLLSAVFVLIGEFWTSILQMIRVGSQHVGGRVARLPWKRHEEQIFPAGVVLFWSVLLLRHAVERAMTHRAGST